MSFKKIGGLFVALTATTATLSLLLSQSVNASSVSVNFGACMSSLTQSGNHALLIAQAPGRSNNGPLTIVNGKVLLPNAFGGGEGCAQ